MLVINRDASAYLLHNRASDGGNWLMFWVLDRAGSPAEGARVTMRVGSSRKMREVRSAYSYLVANDPRVHIGLGDLSKVEVRWPGGETEGFGDFAGNQIVYLRRGAGSPTVP